MELSELLAFATKYKALELRLSPGSPPLMKMADAAELRRVNLPPLTQQDIDEMLKQVLDAKAQEAVRFNGKWEGTHQVQGLGVFGLKATLGEMIFVPPPPAPAKPGFFSKLFGQ